MPGNANSGRTPTPTQVLKLRGSWRAKLRKDEPQPPTGIPQAPTYLDAEQKKVWRRLAKQLDALGIMTKIDGEALGRYVRTWSRWDKAEQFIAEHGLVYPKRDDDDKVVAFVEYPQVGIADRAAAQLLRLEQAFGLHPAARARLQVNQQDTTPPHGNSSKHVYFKPAQ